MKRALDNPEYEPPVRDPKAILITVIALVLIMVIGGFLVVRSYLAKQGEEAEEYAKGRSAMSVGNVRTNFQTKALDGKIYDFTLLEGKLTLMTVISINLPEQSKRIVAEMKKAEERFKGEEKLQFVCISADSEKVVSVEKLAVFAKELGIDKENWFVLTADSEEFGGYLKDGLKLGMISKVDRETKERVLPDLLRIVDPSLKIRGEIDDFKFNFYHALEAKTAKEIAENPKLLENKKVKDNIDRYQNAVSIHRKKMFRNLNYILKYEKTDVAALKKANRSNRYNVPLIVFGALILFILIMGIRVKKLRKGGAKV